MNKKDNEMITNCINYNIKNLYNLMEQEFNNLLKTSYQKSKLNGYEDALWDFKMIAKDFYNIELPVITAPKIEKNKLIYKNNCAHEFKLKKDIFRCSKCNMTIGQWMMEEKKSEKQKLK